MKCSNCGAEVAENLAYCEKCLTRVDAMPASEEPAQPEQEAPAAAPAPSGPPRASGRGRGPSKSDPDLEIWSGRYSPRAMIGTWLLWGLVTLLFVVAGVWLTTKGWFPTSLIAWLILLAIPAALWIYSYSRYLWRRLTIRYRLTTYRFYHEEGLLRHRTDCIEVIDIDDMDFEQNLWERLLGVGTVHIRSSDPSNPVLALTGLDDAKAAFEKIDAARRDERIRRGLNLV